MVATRPPLSHDVDRVPWEHLGPEFIKAWGYPNGRYEPEHLTVYGKTGSGKSRFTSYVLQQRAMARGSHVVVVVTKRDDKTFTDFGWPIIEKWPPGYNQNQVIYWAKAKGLSAVHRAPQRLKVKALMDALWKPKSRIIVCWDELPYIETSLGLKNELETFYREGRSNGITCVAAMQRPAGVSRFCHSEAGWTVAFAPKDADDRKRLAEIFGDRTRFTSVLDDLDRTKHEFVIRHDLTGEAYISNLPPPPSRRVSGGHSAPIGYGVPSRQQNDRIARGH